MSRTLIYDLETSPIISYNWGIWDQNAIEVIEDWQILCFAYKWLGEKKTYVIAQDDFKDYKPGVNKDNHVVKALWELFNEADITIAHNGISFDEKKSNARFIQNGLTPPEPHKAYDTLRVARKHFGFTSNKLNDLGKYLKVGKKAETGGFETWKNCIAGDPKAWKKMKKYNIQDVKLLEDVYLKLRPWDSTHPSMSVLDEKPDKCPRCGVGKIISGAKRAVTATNRYQYGRCNSCGAPCKFRAPDKIEKPLYK